MKSVTLRDMNGNKVLKILKVKGEYVFYAYTKGAGEASVLVITENNCRVLLGPKISGRPKK